MRIAKVVEWTNSRDGFCSRQTIVEPGIALITALKSMDGIDFSQRDNLLNLSIGTISNCRHGNTLAPIPAPSFPQMPPSNMDLGGKFQGLLSVGQIF